MWRFKHFMSKEQNGLEGRVVDVGSLKLHVRNVIAEGGFSCVYVARDYTYPSKQYALKHIICNDDESLDSVKKEISIMKALKGHPNIVTLHSHTVFDMGRTKEALLAMEFCEKSLASLLDSRGAAYFEEKQMLQIFRDICNAVFAMHSQSPPVAHRDLKAENVLLGLDGSWKLCDFGSVSTNHKCFDRPEEMGVEEDNIRKHTTPAYRAPEMWDLFRREIISEKVDIWALGCLLYRICYFKSAFDGESKLQILNGNYRIPELPKYASAIVDLIQDMLQASPDSRPDITKVWLRVNKQLPPHLQKHLPDASSSSVAEEKLGPIRCSTPLPPKIAPPLFWDQGNSFPQCMTSSQGSSVVSGDRSPLGAFWSTAHAREPEVSEGAKFDESLDERAQRQMHIKLSNIRSKEQRQNELTNAESRKIGREILVRGLDDGFMEGLKLKLSSEATHIHESQKRNTTTNTVSTRTSRDEGHNTTVNELVESKTNIQDDDHGTAKISTRSRQDVLEAEVRRLREQLKEANMEKDEMKDKYEKLSTICCSQQQEIQGLRNSLESLSLSQELRTKNSSGSRWSSTLQMEKTEGSVWELHQRRLGSISSTPPQDTIKWHAFPDEQRSQPVSNMKSKALDGQQTTTSVASFSGTCDFGQDCFTANPAGTPSKASDRGTMNGKSGYTNEKHFSQPAGWSGF